jgi:hypothetical protein
MRWTVDKVEGRLKDRGAGAFRANQRACDMETVLWEQLIQVIARDPTRNLGIARAYEVAIAVAQIAQPPVDIAALAASAMMPSSSLSLVWATVSRSPL